MAIDHTAIQPQGGTTSAIKSATLDGTPANATEINPPTWAARVTVRLVTAAGANDSGNFAFEGTDGAAIDADNFPIASGEAFSVSTSMVGRNLDAGPSFFLVAAGASSTARIVYERESRGT